MEFQTLKKRIESLPEAERAARRALYSDEEWRYDWELNAYDHQLPPRRDDWRVWTIVGSPGTGKTTAGIHWVIQKLRKMEGQVSVVLTPDLKMSEYVMSTFWRTLEQEVSHGFIRSADSSRGIRIYDQTTGIRREVLFIVTRDLARGVQGRVDYVWGDEIFDAEEICNKFNGVKQFLFTQPTRLMNGTFLSQAGKQRVKS